MARAVDYAGIYTGAKVDKAERTGLTYIHSEQVGAPTVAEAPLSIECRVCEVLPMGTHDVFVADVVGVTVREDIIDGQGKLRLDRADLLAYAHGEYYALGERLGAFGFSTAKKAPKGKKTPPRVENKTKSSKDGGQKG
jgi:flavin reductase (DIM6/NTAB) family NADH-FMN oxidoreductase RutF